MSHSSDAANSKRPGLTTWVVIGIVLGVVCGLFFGEYTTSIKWMGDVFIGLLQMAVLPYVAVSLVANIGRLTMQSGARLMRISVTVLLVLWAVGLVSLAIMTAAFPAWETGSFFSSRFTEEPPSPDWLDLFVPSNPFRSLANNSIPAVVVFSIGIGIALMNLPNKEKLLEPLEVLVDALATLNKLVVKLTPIGMFAIVAHTAGTIDPQEFSLIQGYLVTYAVAAVVLALVVLPSLVAAVTPLGYWQVLRASRDPLVAAFVIGNSFVVLPMIIEAVRRLEQESLLPVDPGGREPEYLVPMAYPFPDIGRIIGLIFIPFAAWFFGTVIDVDHYLQLLGVGLFGSFGKPVITIPLLLNIAELPSDIFNLYLASGVIAARFGDLMKTMHLLSFALLTMCALGGCVKFRPRLIGTLAGSVCLLALAALGIRGYLTNEFQDRYSKEALVTHRDMMFPENSHVADLAVDVLENSQPNPVPIRSGQSRVQRIKQYGKIRVGFDPNKMPFCYFRADTKVLIGFDVQMAYYLAYDLDVGIEFIPIELGHLHQQLRDDHFDVAMSAIEGSVKQATLLPAVDSYMEVTLAVVVPDHEKRDFRTVEQVLQIPDLKLGVIKNSFFADLARRVLPEEVVVVEMDSATEYFEGRHQEVHGLMITAEAGSAWTLRYPNFTVANPLAGRVQVPLYYVTADDREFENFLQNWLTLKRSRGTYEELYDYWILGLDTQVKAPRWCILRDVLGWVK